jgi:hypothetical protein
MKKNTIYMIILSILIIVGCSKKILIKSKKECFEYEKSLNKLETKRKDFYIRAVGFFLIRGIIIEKDNELDQRIKVLNLKISSEC